MSIVHDGGTAGREEETLVWELEVLSLPKVSRPHPERGASKLLCS